jgi:ElaB/YqjD/DUF883 family membrane-anchored ribosome-binding protein
MDTTSDPGITGASGAERATAGIGRLAGGAHEAVDRATGTASAAAHHVVGSAASAAQHVAESATSAAHHVAESAGAAGHRLAERGQRMVSLGDHWTEATRDCVRRHPIASVGVAIGAGLLLSLITRRPH